MNDSERLYQTARARFLEPSFGNQQVWLLLGSAVLFTLGATTQAGWRNAVVLLGVLTLHELGHFVAMRAVGYVDVRIFFVPFFGAATAGWRVTGTTVLREAAILLAGPLPGILLAFGISFSQPVVWAFHPWLRPTVLHLLTVNAFNLLPIGPLDGGRLVNMALFSRRPFLQVLFAVPTSIGLGAWAYVQRDWFLGALAVATLFFAYSSEALHFAADDLRKSEGAFPPRPTELTDEQLRALYRAGLSLVESNLPRGKRKEHRRAAAEMIVARMRSIHERLSAPTPTLWTGGFAVTAWGLGLALAAYVFIRLAWAI
ncbi:MAG: hypothetical protein HYZ29_20185 [Myxococcales bacterium]|nr:hypothetical protein [Myxococcales bacterium]